MFCDKGDFIRKWRCKEVIKPEHFLMLGLMKSGKLWENVTGQRVWVIKCSRLRETARLNCSDFYGRPSMFGDKDALFLSVHRGHLIDWGVVWPA